MIGKALLIVRATVPEADRAAFDTWYREEHLPDAATAFGAERAWRGWSQQDQSVHLAFYQFSSLDRAESIEHEDILGRLVAEFDRVWQGRVQRSREIVHCAGEIAPGS